MGKKKKKKAPERFSKQGFLLSDKYLREKWLLENLLKDGEYYSVEEVDNLLYNFKNERVK